MINSDVIKNFINHKDGKSLYNYNTLIAYHSDNGKLYINDEKYSVTTSKIQHQIRCEAKHYTEVSEREINTIKLTDDYERHNTSDYIELANSIAQ